MRGYPATSNGLIVVAAFLTVTLFFPSWAQAVVGDVTLTGVPPNTTVIFTNETTGDKVEAKTDDRDDKSNDKGALVIPVGAKNWQAGTYNVTVKEPSGRTVSKPVPLRDGTNEMDLSRILGSTPGAAASDESKKTEEAKKAEEKKPGFWESLAPALIPSFGIGIGGRDDERRRESDPWPGKK